MPSNTKSYMGLQFSIFKFDIDQLTKGHSQSDAQFNSEYLGNGDRQGKNYYYHQIASHIWFFIGIFISDFDPSKDHGQEIMHILTAYSSEMVIDMAIITLPAKNMKQ